MRFLARHGIPYHFLDTSDKKQRDEELLDLVQNTDFLVLARYMQVLPYLVIMFGNSCMLEL